MTKPLSPLPPRQPRDREPGGGPHRNYQPPMPSPLLLRREGVPDLAAHGKRANQASNTPGPPSELPETEINRECGEVACMLGELRAMHASRLASLDR